MIYLYFAAVIYLKNMVMRYWESRSDIKDSFVIHDQDKDFIRNNIIEVIISSPDLLR